MAMSKVIKPFPYAADGFTVERLVIGDERDFAGATNSLVAEQFIEAVTVAKAWPVTAPDVIVEPVVIEPVTKPKQTKFNKSR